MDVWSIVSHHRQQQVFVVSEVAVALDDGVHDGLQFIRLVGLDCAVFYVPANTV